MRRPGSEEDCLKFSKIFLKGQKQMVTNKKTVWMTEKEEGRAQKNTLNMWCCARANSEEKTTQRQLIVCQILPIKKDKRGRSLEKNIPIQQERLS